MSSILYWALLAVVCLSPLPLASNRPLPWSILSLLVGVLLLIWGMGRLWTCLRPGRTGKPVEAVDVDALRLHARRVERYAAILSTGFLVLMVWYWIQASPSLSGAWAHGAWAEASAALGEVIPGTISLAPAASRTLMMKILAYGGVFLLALQLGRGRGRPMTAFWMVCLTGFGYAFYGLFVHFTQMKAILWYEKSAYPDSVTATFINRNAYATYAGIAMIAGLAPLLFELRRLRQPGMTPLRFIAALSEQGSMSLYLVILSTATGMVAVALTGSRAGMACVVLGLAVFAVGLVVTGDIKRRTFVIGAIVGGIAVAGVLTLSGDYLFRRLLTTDAAPEARASLFEVALSAVAAHPWLGQGLGAFGPAFNLANDGSVEFGTYIDLAHNAYLELAVEGGIPALALSVLLIVVAVGISAAGLLSRNRGTGTSLAAVAIAVLVAVHSTVDFGIQMPATAVTFMLLIAMAASMALSVEPAGHVQRIATDDHHARRGRFGRDRPTSADEPVTPEPELEIVRPVHTISDVRARLSGRAVLSAPTAGDDSGSDIADTYESALARWRALRRGGPDEAGGDPTDDGLVGMRPPSPARMQSEKTGSLGVPADPPKAPQPGGALPPRASRPVIIIDDAGDEAQPPDWPGADPDHDPDKSRAKNIVDQQHPRRR